MEEGSEEVGRQHRTQEVGLLSPANLVSRGADIAEFLDADALRWKFTKSKAGKRGRFVKVECIACVAGCGVCGMRVCVCVKGWSCAVLCVLCCVVLRGARAVVRVVVLVLLWCAGAGAGA